MAFFTPSLQGLMSKRLGPSVQGELQGANGSLSGIAGMIGPSLFSGIYAFGLNGSSSLAVAGAGLPFLVAAGCLLVGLVVAYRTLRQPHVA